MTRKTHSDDYTTSADRPGRGNYSQEVLPGRGALSRILSYENIPPRRKTTKPCLSSWCAAGQHKRCPGGSCTCTGCNHSN